MATQLQQVELSAWGSPLPLQVTKRGQKATNITFQGGLPPLVSLTTSKCPMIAPYGASTFQDPDAVRLTMELVVLDSQVEKLKEIDTWAEPRAKELGCKGEYKGLMSEDKIVFSVSSAK